MTHASRSAIVEAKPIAGGLDAFRESARLLHGELVASTQSTNEGFRDYALDLISVLQILPASRLLPSASGGKNLFSDLSRLNQAINAGDFDIQRVIPLLDAVLDRACDTVVWDKVYDLLTESTLATRPPRSTPPQSGPLRTALSQQNLRLPAVQHSDQLMWYPCGLSLRDLLGAGTSGFAGRLDAAVKWTLPKNVHFIERERQIYERLGSYHGILRYYGPVENGILLEFAHHGSIRQYRMKHDGPIPPTTKLRWIQQVTSTIYFLHSKGVLHGDISCNNIFLDQNLNAKVADFAGSPIDGQPYLTCYESSHSHPNIQGVCVQSEIFALGSTFYEIVTGSKPYSNLSINEVEDAYSHDDFPRLDGLDICHSTIAKCWGRRYMGMESLLRDITTEVEATKTKKQSVVTAFPCITLSKAAVVLCLVPAVIWLRARRR